MSTQAPVEIALYERPGCCLCTEMRAVLNGLGGETPFRLRCIDISTDPALEARFGTEVPVLFVDGRKAFKYRVTPAALRIRLRRASASRR